MISRQVLKRGFATAAARSPLAAISEEKVSRLQSGLTVASVDVGGPVSNVVLAFRAGARYESADEAGLVHHLRNLIGTDSANFLGTKMLWQAGSIGAQLSSTATNDLLFVQMSVIRDNADIALSLLGELAQPACKAWDVDDRKETLSYDRAYSTPYDKLLEHVHKAAYRNGSLGNRIISKNHRVGKVSFRQLADFADARLRAGEAALVGINVDHGNLLRYASEQLRLADGTAKAAAASPYLGGDVRHEANGDFAHVALVGEGAGLSDTKNVAVQSVLASLIGNGSNLKYSNGVGLGVVAQAVQKAANGQPVGVSSINISHSDAGLTGVCLVADSSRVAPLVSAAAHALKSIAGSVDEQALVIAKASAKVDVLTRADEGAALAADQATQLLASGNAISPVDFAKLIDAVTAADVKKAAEQMAKKLSLAAHGKINQVPYLDQL
uniref:Peptidase_M16 domain-containing protein n=1 Tax=Steinernema glaseri TaxID=37863 RepID=A0A1I8ARR5_9BILA